MFHLSQVKCNMGIYLIELAMRAVLLAIKIIADMCEVHVYRLLGILEVVQGCGKNNVYLSDA